MREAARDPIRDPVMRASCNPLMRALLAVAIAMLVVGGCGSTAQRVSARAAVHDSALDMETDLGADLGADFDDAERDDGEPDEVERANGSPPRDGPPGDPRGVRSADHRRLDRTSAPPIAEVLAAAYASAGLGGRLPGHLAARARLGGLVPWVSVRTGRDASWHDEDPDVGRGTTLEVRATWRLDRLVFDGRELQVVALEAARRRERRRLATHVIRTYFAWKRSGSPMRAAEAAAELDALTSGWFSEQRQRSASEVRTVGGPAATP